MRVLKDLFQSWACTCHCQSWIKQWRWLKIILLSHTFYTFATVLETKCLLNSFFFAGQKKRFDRCIHEMCDDIVQVFTAGWCPGMFHSSGDKKSSFHCKLVSHRCALANRSVLTVWCWQYCVCHVKIMIGHCNILPSLGLFFSGCLENLNKIFNIFIQ